MLKLVVARVWILSKSSLRSRPCERTDPASRSNAETRIRIAAMSAIALTLGSMRSQGRLVEGSREGALGDKPRVPTWSNDQAGTARRGFVALTFRLSRTDAGDRRGPGRCRTTDRRTGNACRTLQAPSGRCHTPSRRTNCAMMGTVAGPAPIHPRPSSGKMRPRRVPVPRPVRIPGMRALLTEVRRR
jgi:hypothetical protein